MTLAVSVSISPAASSFTRALRAAGVQRQGTGTGRRALRELIPRGDAPPPC
ncbi:hypothetical protein [Caenimonas sp. SL110]|uniref:hypothetical protein n=1 Tax=Caenimonas sp. SL110 TaxID=1450524 RepID=UPI00137921E6|nr:hypothetical protein [Caenimonas sp. SL110]